jgi:hypothetical protein
MKEYFKDVEKSTGLDTTSCPVEQHSENTVFLLHVVKICDSDLNQKTICHVRSF